MGNLKLNSKARFALNNIRFENCTTNFELEDLGKVLMQNKSLLKRLELLKIDQDQPPQRILLQHLLD